MKNGCLLRLAGLGQLLGRVPLEVAVGRQQAAPLRERPLERRLLRDGLHPGVDHPVADRGVLGPGRDQPPAEHPELALRRLLLLRVVAEAARRRRTPPWWGRRCSRARAARGIRDSRRPRTPRRGPRDAGWRRSGRTCGQPSPTATDSPRRQRGRARRAAPRRSRRWPAGPRSRPGWRTARSSQHRAQQRHAGVPSRSSRRRAPRTRWVPSRPMVSLPG